MSQFRCFLVLLLIWTTAARAGACTNYSRASACWIHPYATLIFVGTVLEASPAPSELNGEPILAVRFRVDEAFKGTEEGKVVSALARLRPNCCGALPPLTQGSRFLLFTFGHQDEILLGPCDPVIPIAEAGDHLTYLRNLDLHRVPTEVRGLVYLWNHFTGENPESTPVAGLRLTLKSDAGAFETITDEEGRFHRNLPPGNYQMQADLPSYIDRSDLTEFTLPPESCAELSISLQYTGRIQGRAMDDHRHPAAGAAISLLIAATDEEVNFTWTDGDGNFTLDGIAPGEYVLGLNVGPLPDKDKPYATTFYPSESTRAAAQVIQVEPGQQITLGPVTASTDECDLDVRVSDAKGRPVSGATLAAGVLDRDRFYLLYDPEIVIDGRAAVRTWGHGRVQMYAKLEIPGGSLQSEAKWLQLCPRKPVILKLNHRYRDHGDVLPPPDRP